MNRFFDILLHELEYAWNLVKTPILICGVIATLGMFWLHHQAIEKLRYEVRSLTTNDIHRIQVNDVLSRKMTEAALIRSERVSEQLRNLDLQMKRIYGTNITNKLSGAVH
jgi:hypothetical protein